MPYQVKKQKDGTYKLWNLHKKEYANKTFKTKESALSMGETWMKYRKENPEVKGNIIKNKAKGLTWKEKYNKKYGFSKDEGHTINEISKTTGFQLKGLKKIVEKGEGAFSSSPKSVRPHIQSPREWGIARLYSSVMGGPAAKIDKDLLIKK